MSHSAKPSGLSGLFFSFKGPTFFPMSYPTLNTQVGVVEHLWNLALWRDFPAIPAAQLQNVLYIYFSSLMGYTYSSLDESHCEGELENQSSFIGKQSG